MRTAPRAVWVGTFDREPFIATTLRVGTGLSLGLLALGMAWCALTNQFWTQTDLQGTNVLQLFSEELRVSRAEGLGPTIFIHAGIVVLLLIPLVRVVASAWYFAVVERQWPYVLLTGAVAAALAFFLLLG